MRPQHFTALICMLLMGSAALASGSGHAGGASSTGAGAAHGGAAGRIAKASYPISAAIRGMRHVSDGLRGDSVKSQEICRYNEGGSCYQLVELRKVALQARTEDGGTLTPEHVAILQTKLDALLAQTR